MSNRRNIQMTYTPHNKATMLDCNFVVDHTNGNGFGIRSLKDSGRILNVFMNTSATPGTAASGAVNPNPAAGVIVLTLQDNYARYLAGSAAFAAPLSGSSITSGLTVGNPYVIVSLGSSTQAQWVAAGLSPNIVAAVGVSFIAAATSVAGGGAVQAPATNGAGIDHIEVLGDSNLMNSQGPAIAGSGKGASGMQFILLCYKNGVLTAPADNTVIGLQFLMNDSAQGV